jgi:hypothetical protein
MERPPVEGGPWGGFMDVVLCLFPIIFLVYATLKKNPLPTTKSLPLAAAMIWVIRIAYLNADPAEVTSQAISGALSAVTPITIVGGAIFLFDSMESAHCIMWMRFQMEALTDGHHGASPPRSGRARTRIEFDRRCAARVIARRDERGGS